MGDSLIIGKERRIVVAVDESEQSTYALKWCLENLISDDEEEEVKDHLILLFARPPRAVMPALDGTSVPGIIFSDEVADSMEKYSRDLASVVMEKAQKTCEGLKNVRVETKVGVGDARDVICDMVEKLGADILVMGSHGYGLIKRAFLGSVSNYCAQNVKCAVLVVKQPKETRA